MIVFFFFNLDLILYHMCLVFSRKNLILIRRCLKYLKKKKYNQLKMCLVFVHKNKFCFHKN
ncbi:hypothetical protein BpHYR1_014271 [Brachionus plicatilis]|uniref:Uncharacterized protein n=1 Tax=Brachionus plicatilis TaxID=10195 RepID=A0A3M7SVV4_BRAPC|nr:hypothetical protein BpHYR1_014271 [Brachionus plicatilis]